MRAFLDDEALLLLIWERAEDEGRRRRRDYRILSENDRTRYGFMPG